MEKKTTTMSEKKTTSKKTAAKKMPVMPTLLQAIERVVEMSKDSCLSEKFMTEAAPEIQLLSESFGITDVQAVLFCICMERGPRNVDYNDFACHLDLSKIRVLSYANDIDALVADGEHRTIDHPKKKKWKHLQVIKTLPDEVNLLAEDPLNDSLIKKILMTYQNYHTDRKEL